MKHKMKGLTVKQEAFCLEYAKTGDAQEAYRQVYNPKASMGVAAAYANRLLKTPEVLARLQELQKKAEDDSIADIKEIKQRLTSILRQEAEEEVLMTEGVDKGVTETVRYRKKADLRTAAKAAELLAKMAGAFSDGTQMNVGVQVVVQDDLSE